MASVSDGRPGDGVAGELSDGQQQIAHEQAGHVVRLAAPVEDVVLRWNQQPGGQRRREEDGRNEQTGRVQHQSTVLGKRETGEERKEGVLRPTCLLMGTEAGWKCSEQVNTYTFRSSSRTCSRQNSPDEKILPESVVTEPVCSCRRDSSNTPAIACSLQAGNP
uniref:Uncharacterized protein n=1 Tax=Anopheles atroparvus TaxID=41427 RepID=A0A182IZB1_ANOAO